MAHFKAVLRALFPEKTAQIGQKRSREQTADPEKTQNQENENIYKINFKKVSFTPNDLELTPNDLEMTPYGFGMIPTYLEMTSSYLEMIPNDHTMTPNDLKLTPHGF